MSTTTIVEKLRAAAKLMADVRDTLNQDRRRCECCGLTVYADMGEFTRRQMLNAAIERATKAADEVENQAPDCVRSDVRVN